MDGYHVRTGLDGGWDPEVADMLLQVLLQFSNTVNFTDECEAQMCLPDIKTSLKSCIRCKYSLKDVVEQYARVEERHDTFQWLLQQPGVVHDKTSNRMFVPPEVRVLAKNTRPKATKYFYYGDDRWDTIKMIFKNKTEVSTTQSIIESNQYEIQGGYNNPIEISDSGPLIGTVVPHIGYSNSNDQGSAISDISSWEDEHRRIRMRHRRVGKGKSSEVSTAGSRPFAN